jgi:hypothetical protein
VTQQVTLPRRRLAAAGVLLLALSACSAAGEQDSSSSRPSETTASDGSHGGHDAQGAASAPKPLRAGERRVTLRMPEPYEPSAPTGVGTDDYRCFLLDPALDHDAYLTGTNVLPGNPDVVHHVILFRVPPDQVASAESMDAATSGQGWTCFGGTGLDPVESLNDAPWLGAWAPGGGETVHQAGYGVRLDEGSRIVMQVHYNLLAGTDEDVSATQLRLAPADRRLTEVRTMLLPAPVELPCRPAHDDAALCDRDAAVADVRQRFGQAGATADGLYFLCGGRPRPGNVQSCTRTISEPATLRGTAGHMHLLGRSIRIEVNPGTDRARTVLDIPVWDFDNQSAKPVPAYRLRAGDTVKVTCRHVQWLRDKLPAFEGQPDRYVVWGEGTTDEMCLGILQVTRS